MPCKVCSKTMIYYQNKFKCAACEGLQLLEYDEAVSVYSTQVQFIRDKWHEYLSKFNRDSIILEAARYRERYCRNILLSSYSTINLDTLFILTVIIQQAALFCNTTRGHIVSDISFEEVIKMGKALVTTENIYTYIKANYFSIVTKEPFSQGKFSPDQFSKIMIVENERYSTIRETFKEIDIFTAQVAKEKEDEILRNIQDKERIYRDYTAEQFISACYPLILSMYGGLLRSKYYSDIFDLRQFDNILGDPAELMKLVWNFRIGDDLCFSSVDFFVEKASKTLNLSKNILKKNLLFGPGFDGVFPLFIVIAQGGKKSVIISHRFAYFIYAILHASITKPLFDAETERLSSIFEKDKVKTEFENCGYNYINSQLVRSTTGQMEIDGIASKDGICYVIECKSWRFPPFVEEKSKVEQIKRDIEGIIDGKKYTTRNGVIQFKKVKSLQEKVGFIKINKSKYGLDGVHIVGLIVTQHPPPIVTYKDVKIISLSQIAAL